MVHWWWWWKEGYGCDISRALCGADGWLTLPCLAGSSWHKWTSIFISTYFLAKEVLLYNLFNRISAIILSSHPAPHTSQNTKWVTFDLCTLAERPLTFTTSWNDLSALLDVFAKWYPLILRLFNLRLMKLTLRHSWWQWK